MEILLKLFLTFLKIGLVSIGGGYAVIPSIHEEVVVKAGWIGEKVFADIITISPDDARSSGSEYIYVCRLADRRCGRRGCGNSRMRFLRSCDFIDSVSFFQKHKESVYIFETLNGLKAASLGLIVSAAATIILLSFSEQEIRI